MKKLVAIIDPFQADIVRDRICEDLGYRPEMFFSEVKGLAASIEKKDFSLIADRVNGENHPNLTPGRDYDSPEFRFHTKVEIIIPENEIEVVAHVILKAAEAGHHRHTGPFMWAEPIGDAVVIEKKKVESSIELPPRPDTEKRTVRAPELVC